MINKIHNEDCLTGLKKLDAGSIDCCVTSPPYFGLRDYGTAKWEGGTSDCSHSYVVHSPYNENFNERYGNSPGKKKQESQRHEKTYKNVCKDCGAVRVDSQIGLEETPEMYVDKIVQVFEEVKRVMKKEGTLWLNLGDSYASNTKGNGRNDTVKMYGDKSQHLAINNKAKVKHGVKEKDLIGIPWLVAFALRSAGWYLRQDIIWHKPNPMPESVTDRCTKSHEYIFLLSKSSKYYYDNAAIGSKILEDTIKRYERGWNGNGDRGFPNGPQNHIQNFMNPDNEKRDWANKKSVWTVNTYPYSEAHFATFPEDLIVDMIKAGCPEGGTVLDPFMGAGTTALVSRKLNRNYVGLELNQDYIKIAEKRLRDELGMFL